MEDKLERPAVRLKGGDPPLFEETWNALYGRKPPRPPVRRSPRKVKDNPQA